MAEISESIIAQLPGGLDSPKKLKPKAEPLPAVVEAPREKASFCKPSDRAPKGWNRYRIRADIPGGSHPPRYVLAKTRSDAEAEYIMKMQLTEEAAMKDKNGKPVFQLRVVALPD